jgi:hypothetical protein
VSNMASHVSGLSWIEFLRSYGLEVFDPEDIQEASDILSAMDANLRCSSDTFEALTDIRRHCRASISSVLLSVQNCKVPRGQTQRWIENLDCLYVKTVRKNFRDGAKKKYIGRRRINPRSGPDYVAVSYTWEPSEGEAIATGGYSIECRDKQEFIPTGVRDVVLDRVVKYARHYGCKYFWIDKECINQDDSKQKELAIQSMDLVYQLSSYPIALLSIRIHCAEWLNILANLLNGAFVEEKPSFKLRYGITWKTGMALRMLQKITADRWWTRAWTFQEDYRASTKMTLLFAHTDQLEALKLRSSDLFGTLRGELCVNSADFRTEASRFCLAYRNERRVEAQDAATCNLILQRAGKYTTILENYSFEAPNTICNPMSPLIFTDLNSRELTDQFDILAIVANVCNYSVRLNTKLLQAKRCSLSMAMLALYLLNGEIIINHDKLEDGESRSLLKNNVLEFLQKWSLNSFKPPVAQKLTFAKNCRLINVKLTKDGIRADGHVWKLGRTITVDSRSRVGWENDSPVGLTGCERYWLKRLIWTLKSGELDSKYLVLAAYLENYLKEDAATTISNASKEFKDCMASEIIEAMKSGEMLRLASVVDGQSPKSSSSYCGIFVNSTVRDSQYVFTSWSRPDTPPQMGKHVSLRVTLEGYTEDGVPCLVTRGWINGLFFFHSNEGQTVVFPWPASFTT